MMKEKSRIAAEIADPTETKRKTSAWLAAQHNIPIDDLLYDMGEGGKSDYHLLDVSPIA